MFAVKVCQEMFRTFRQILDSLKVNDFTGCISNRGVGI
jgi:hypothetical protein